MAPTINLDLPVDLFDALSAQAAARKLSLVTYCGLALGERAINEPPAIKQAGEREMAAEFARTRLVPTDIPGVPSGIIYAAYRQWCKEKGLEPVTSNLLGRIITEGGMVKSKGDGGMIYWCKLLRDIESA